VALTKIPGSLIDTASGINGLIYPSSDGTAGQFLKTDGSGNLTFATVTTYTDSDVETYLDGGTSTPTFATATVSGTLTVTGDLDLTGDINSYNVTDLDITDQTITLGAGQTEALSGGSGIIVDGSNASILWDETTDGWVFNKQIAVNADDCTTASSLSNIVVGEYADTSSGIVLRGTTASALNFEDNSSVTAARVYYNHASGYMAFNTEQTERLRIDSSGNVGIGTSSPVGLSGQTSLTINGSVARVDLQVSQTTTGSLISESGYIHLKPASGGKSLIGNGGSDLVVDSSGLVGIGTDSPMVVLNVHNPTNPRIALTNNTTGQTFPAGLELLLAGGDAYIAQRENSPLIFTTSNVERTRITAAGILEHSGSNGAFAFGASSGNVTRIRGNADGMHMHYGAEGNPRLSIGRDEYQSGQAGIVFNEAGYGKANGGVGIGSATRGQLAFSTSDYTTFTERMRIKNDGTVMINRTSSFGAANSTTLMLTGSGNSSCAYWTCPNTANYDIHVFFNGGLGVIGSIKQNSSLNGVAYNTTSDYRLKENVSYEWDATTRLKQLKPCRFNWISDETNTLEDGFLAHEVATSVPNAVSGVKDAMIPATYYDESDQEVVDGDAQIGDIKEEAKIDPQQVDHSKLVPLLVKTIQELEARITELENA